MNLNNDILDSLKKHLKNNNNYLALFENKDDSKVIKHLVKQIERIIDNTKSSSDPQLKVVLGQAGAGKSFVIDEMDDIDSYIKHDLDSWREKTLYYKESIDPYLDISELDVNLSKDYGYNTHLEVSLYGDVIRDIAIQYKMNLLYEGAGLGIYKDNNDNYKSWLIEEIDRFSYNDFDINIKIDIVSTNSIISNFSTKSRYEKELSEKGLGRLVEKNYHDLFFNDLNHFMKELTNINNKTLLATTTLQSRNRKYDIKNYKDYKSKYQFLQNDLSQSNIDILLNIINSTDELVFNRNIGNFEQDYLKEYEQAKYDLKRYLNIKIIDNFIDNSIDIRKLNDLNDKSISILLSSINNIKNNISYTQNSLKNKIKEDLNSFLDTKLILKNGIYLTK